MHVSTSFESLTASGILFLAAGDLSIRKSCCLVRLSTLSGHMSTLVTTQHSGMSSARHTPRCCEEATQQRERECEAAATTEGPPWSSW